MAKSLLYNSPFGYSAQIVLRKEQYANNGKLCLQAFDAETGEPYFTATVNVPSVKLNDDQAIIKNYSENAGMLDFLKSIGIVKSIYGTDDMPIATLDMDKLNELTA